MSRAPSSHHSLSSVTFVTVPCNSINLFKGATKHVFIGAGKTSKSEHVLSRINKKPPKLQVQLVFRNRTK